MDIDSDSVGCRFARAHGIPVFDEMEALFSLDGLSMVFELVGDDGVLDTIYRLVPAGVRVVDHVMAQVYWELETSQRRFNQIIDTAYSAISIKDISGFFLFANKRTAEFFSIPQHEFVGKTNDQLFSKEVADLFSASEKKVAELVQHESVDEVIHMNGKKHCWQTERFPILDRLGNAMEICSISRDITNEERLKEELIQSVKMATLGQLAAGVAHEINNPLTGILSFAENAQLDVGADDPVSRDLDLIIRETLRCRQIVRDLLDYSRISSPQTVNIQMEEIVDRALTMVSKQVAFQDVEIIYHNNGPLPKVAMDPNQAQQVILNLLINAQEAMAAKGRIDIYTWANEEAERIVVEVADNGCGIAEENLEKIFAPFYSSKGAQGNGLGLSVVQRIIEAHQGEISVESALGEGTRFRLDIPWVF
jgi:PAS domain S-box-containing protein